MTPNSSLSWNAKIERALKLKIPLLREQYLFDLISNKTKLTLEAYKTEIDLIKCSCGSTEEEGFMIKCEKCHSWQHGSCTGIKSKLNAPEHYICSECACTKLDEIVQDQQVEREERVVTVLQEQQKPNTVVECIAERVEKIEETTLKESCDPKCGDEDAQKVSYLNKFESTFVPFVALPNVEVCADTDCGICLLELHDGQALFTLDICKHVFHLSCLAQCVNSRAIQKRCQKCYRELSWYECSKIIKEASGLKRRKRSEDRKNKDHTPAKRRRKKITQADEEQVDDNTQVIEEPQESVGRPLQEACEMEIVQNNAVSNGQVSFEVVRPDLVNGKPSAESPASLVSQQALLTNSLNNAQADNQLELEQCQYAGYSTPSDIDISVYEETIKKALKYPTR